MARTTADSAAPWDAKRNATPGQFVRRAVGWVFGGLFVALILWGLWPKPTLIEVGKASMTPLTVRVSEEGKTRVRNRYVIAAPVAGKMRRMPFRPGDEVKAGETQFTQIEPLEISLLDPRARTQAEQLVSLRQAAKDQAEQNLVVARESAQLAEANRARYAELKTSGAVAPIDQDRIFTEARLRAAQVRAAEFALQVAGYEWEQAKAALTRPGKDAADQPLPLVSPVSGRVLRVMQESETTLGAGAEILEVGDPADIEIEAEILSRDAVTMKPGDLVDIEQWGDEQPLKARVRRVEPAAFTKISALGVEEQRVIVLSDLFDVPETAKRLGDRYRVEVRVATWHQDSVLTVPAGALFREGNVWKAFVFRDGKAVLTALEVGHSDGRLSEILKGLKEGDEVLLHPPDTIKDGSRVRKP
jgi:HlyD family secretion protein